MWQTTVPRPLLVITRHPKKSYLESGRVLSHGLLLHDSRPEFWTGRYDGFSEHMSSVLMHCIFIYF